MSIIASGGLSRVDSIIVAVVAGALFLGIAFWVWYDARHHVKHGHAEESIYGERAHAGSKAPHKSRKLKRAERKRRKRGRAR